MLAPTKDYAIITYLGLIKAHDVPSSRFNYDVEALIAQWKILCFWIIAATVFITRSKPKLILPHGTSDKTFASDMGGKGIQISSRSNLPHVANDSPPLQTLKCGLWRKVGEMGPASLVTPEKVLSEYNKDLIFWFDTLPKHILPTRRSSSWIIFSVHRVKFFGRTRTNTCVKITIDLYY